ncbi:type II toxin-antitoxin system VapB family antitoxin [Fodinicola feengrottensis]
MNIKDPEAEQLAAELATLTGETKTAAVRAALRERLERLRQPDVRKQRHERMMRVLEEEIWPQIPPEVRGKSITKQEREEILGFGPEDV